MADGRQERAITDINARAHRVTRRIAGITIAAFWVVMMLLLARSELIGGFLRGDVVLDRAGWVDEPVDNWLTIHGPLPQDRDQNDGEFGPRVGYAHMTQKPVNRNGIEGAEMTLEVQLVLQLLGRQAALELGGSAWRARHQRLAEIDFSVRSGEANFRLVGRIVDDAFEATIDSGGETSEFSTKLADNALFSTGFGTNLSFPRLQLNELITIQSFDPMTLRPSRSTVRAISSGTLEVSGSQVPATRLEVRSSGLRTIAWVDGDGQVLQATTPLGLSIRKSTREQALAEIPAADNATELLRITAVKPSGHRPTRGAQRITARLPGVSGWGDLQFGSATDAVSAAARTAESMGRAEDLAALSIPLDWRQRKDGESFTFLAALLPDSTDSFRNQGSEPSDKELRSYLGADAFIQSAHPRIREQADAIIKASPSNQYTGDLGRAFALHDWVFERLEKEPVLSLPSALEVLKSKRGDCNEHTILYTALARSIGLPTRVAIGLVWSDVYDGFYYHAWPEVWLDAHASWIALDPTLGQRLADATHIKLLEGSIDRWTQLLPFLGQIEIEVLETQ